MRRELEPSEIAIACPKCGATAGRHCTLAWCNEPGISAVAHVERKRAAGRAWRVGRIVDVLHEHGHRLRGEPSLDRKMREVAELIDDALHDRSKP